MSDATNLRDTIIPNSNQLNAEQLISGPMTIKVTSVVRGAADQPVVISYQGDDGRPFKPCKTCRKVLIFAWGDDGREWIGRSLTLFCDPEVKFGGVKVGGIRISHMSHIEKDIALSLNTTKGKKGEFFIRRLEVTEKAAPTLADRLAAVRERFAKIGVGVEEIEEYLGHPFDAAFEEELPALSEWFKTKKAEKAEKAI